MSHELKIYNTQTQSLEVFKPAHPPVVKMYCCGPTVYDFLHVGNFRGAIFYSFVRAWLEEKGFKVTSVYNYTDVDDKIIQRAAVEKMPPLELSEKYIQEFEKDFARLKIRPTTFNPKVSEHLEDIRSMIQGLVAQEKAYASKSDVYFSVKSFPSYGALSGRKIEDLQSSAKTEASEQKKDALDFALWKSAKPGEPSWDSPWGAGRPGWHIECSAMIQSLLGGQIDIHGGGLDLLFPHHENERAQSEGLSGQPFVRYWLHHNMIEFGGAKMSKSLGNIRTARSFMDEYGPEVLKYLILSVHYRSICDFSENGIESAFRNLARIYSSLSRAHRMIQFGSTGTASKEQPKVVEDFAKALQEHDLRIGAAFDDDFGTPLAFASIFEVVRKFNSLTLQNEKQPQLAQMFFAFVTKWGRLLSLFQEPPQEYLQYLDDILIQKKGLSRQQIQRLVDQRAQARVEKNWALSDQVRDELAKLGVSVQDKDGQSFWEMTKSLS